MPPFKIEVAKTVSVKYEEVFHMKKFYVYLRDWLKDRGYIDDNSEKWMETYHLDKNTPGGREIWLWWRTQRTPDGNPYIQYKLNLDFHVLMLKDVEIVHQGKKVKANKGEVEVMVSAWVIFDPDDSFDKSWLLKKYKHFFLEDIYHDQLEVKRLELQREVKELLDAMRQYLQQPTQATEELFHPVRGLG